MASRAGARRRDAARSTLLLAMGLPCPSLHCAVPQLRPSEANMSANDLF